MNDIIPPEFPPIPPDAGRTVFLISDGTGITAETLANSILTQFNLRFTQLRFPFTDTEDKAYAVTRRIKDAEEADGKIPLVFSTLVEPAIATIIRKAHAIHMDLLYTFVTPLEQELGVQSLHTVGRSHNIADVAKYNHRIDAINYTLAHDDGQTNRNLEEADIILVGVSRSGKTPTSLYLAMQFGIKAANYPLIPEDFERGQFPPALEPFKNKIFGLTITPERLSTIRNERRPDSKYASIENCRYEISEAEKMMKKQGITWMSSTTKSIEEISTTILQELKPLMRY